MKRPPLQHGKLLAFLLLAGCHAGGPDRRPGNPVKTAIPTATNPSEPRSPLTREQMEADLLQLATTIKSAWAYEEEKRLHFGVDVDRLHKRALRQLDQVHNDAQFARVLREFMASLREGHAEIHAGHLAPPPGRYWPLMLRPVREGVAVTGGDPALLAKAGVQPGDLLKKVDGQPIEALVEATARTVSASSLLAQRSLALDRAAATSAARITVELERADGSMRRITLPTVAAQPRMTGMEPGRFLQWKQLSARVGYVRIPTFGWQPPQPPASGSMADLDRAMEPAKREVDEAFTALRDTQTLILDLRGNQGGSVFLASYVAEHLLAPGFVYHSGERRRSPEALQLPDIAALPANYWGKAHPWKPSEAENVRHCTGPTHRGRLLVLIDELCFSSVDDLAACLEDLHPNVRFIGRPTNGGTGEPRVIAKLQHSGADVQFCLMQMRSPNGRLIEGKGTLPDVPVTWSRTDVAGNRDPDLAVALGTAP